MAQTCFHTSDMALVAYLSTRSFSPRDMQMPRRVVIWYFDDGAALQRELDEYRRGEAVVEPREFMQHVARVREEMYSSFDVQRRGRHAS